MVMGEQTLATQVAVIGGGPGGYAAAFRAADLGLDVTLIDAEPHLGGVCLLRGCIPSKALLQVTKLLRDTPRADAWGLTFDRPKVDLEKMRTWKDEVVATLAKGLSQLSQQRQVNVIQARATFEASDQVRLHGADLAHITFEHAILATGSEPIALPDAPFKTGSRIMDAAAALALPDIPETLLVVGGGYIGLELGSIYAALGSRVTIVEMTDSLLPEVDRDLVRPLAQRAERLFEAVHLHTKVAALKEHDESVEVSLEGQINQHGQRFARVLVAIGRRPNTQDLGLDRTRVELTDQKFVVVDEHQRTTDDHIFAVGDMVGEPMLAHKAMHEGKIAAEVIAGEPAAFDVRCIPAIVYTDPEVAWCGLMEEGAHAQGRAITVGRFPWRASGRAYTLGATDGFTKLIFEAETKRVVGMGVVGPGAEDLIAEGALAVGRPLEFVAYEMLAVKGEEFKAHTEALQALRAWGLRVPQRAAVVSGVEAVIEHHARCTAERDGLDYEIDGIVIKLDDLKARERLGVTAHHPRWALAYKFEPRHEITRVEDIVVQVGRTGILTPVALLRPIEVGGVTVSRASLHNREIVQRKDVRVGDRVRIQRAGDVIPEVVERVEEPGRRRQAPFQMPSACPACGAEVVQRGPYTACPNRFGCRAQLTQQIQHFASKDVLDIDGLGLETVSALVHSGLVQSVADLFRLDTDDLLQIERFAARSARQLVEAIQRGKRVELRRFLSALGIPEVGTAVARDLADHFRNLDAVRHASRRTLEAVPRIGPKLAEAIHGFFAEARNQQAIDALLEAGVQVIEPAAPQAQPLAGKTFVFTGALDRFSRHDAEQQVEALGAHATSAVSGETDYVVVGKDPGHKLEAARARGVQILTEPQFIALLREAGVEVSNQEAGGRAGAAAERKEGAAMENVEIARVLNEYADLLDIQGDSPFRVRAYRNAAQTVASLSQPVAQLIEAGEDLEKLPGIGSSMAEHIEEIVETGTLSRLEEVRRAGGMAHEPCG